jgi:hypothetical protein
MALSDPQSVTISGTAISLPLTGRDLANGVYTSSDGTTKLSVSHVSATRNRTTIRLDLNKLASDPYVAGNSNKVSSSVYIVVNTPKNGYSTTEMVAATVGLLGLLTAGTNAVLTKVIGGES